MMTVVVLLVVGVYLAFTTGQFLNVWLLWAVLAQVFGLRHPPPLDDLTPFDQKRQLIGWAAIIIFFLILTPLRFPSNVETFKRSATKNGTAASPNSPVLA